MRRKTANKKHFNFILFKNIFVLCMLTSGFNSLHVPPHTLEASDSCFISRKTVQKVENCPDSKEKWEKAASRKNCSAYASQCDEPERLVYHCVISSFINETLEVCAYAQNIVLGHCTDYSISGNLIKQNSRTNCRVFETKPCPVFYLSTDAYKYPGCYKLTKRSTTHHSVLSSSFDALQSTTNPSRISKAGKKQEFGNSPGKVLILICTLSFLALLGIFMIITFIRFLKIATARKSKEYLLIISSK